MMAGSLYGGGMCGGGMNNSSFGGAMGGYGGMGMGMGMGGPLYCIYCKWELGL